MTSTATQTANLMMSNGKSAADMTHAVKVLGNGSLQKRFFRIGAYFAKETEVALARGRLHGCFLGILGTVIVCGIAFYTAKKNRKPITKTKVYKSFMQ